MTGRFIGDTEHAIDDLQEPDLVDASGFVAYLTTLPLAGADQVRLWRVVRGGDNLWFERFGAEGWRQDDELRSALDAIGTIRLTPTEARWVATDQYGCSW